MDNRSLAIKFMSEAVSMDSLGNQEVAFAKYLQSLQVLTVYLNDMFTTSGFIKIIERNQEVKQVLSMIHECSERVSIIIDRNTSTSSVEQKQEQPAQLRKERRNAVSSYSIESSKSNKFPAFQEMQNENMKLMRRYQWRSERLQDNSAKINLRLELERQLIENTIIAKNKYNITVRQLQTERSKMMEKEMRKLLQKGIDLTDKQIEKQELYLSVLEYTKTETWPCTWELNSVEMECSEVVKTIFQKTVRCGEHPLSQWLLASQTNIKREIDLKLKKYSDYKSLPDILNTGCLSHFQERSSEYIVHSTCEGTLTVPKSLLATIGKFLKPITSEIANTIANVLEIFYLIYKALLPEDSEEICHRLIETHIMDPIWPNFLLLFRLSNIPAEHKIMLTMVRCGHSDPAVFGFSSKEPLDPGIYTDCMALLQTFPKSRSMSEKLKIIVEVCQTICGTPSNKKVSRRRLGADDLIPLLCYVIVKSGMAHLCSECYAIDQLFDMKYMFGEEGYALSTFLTALKYIEITKLVCILIRLRTVFRIGIRTCGPDSLESTPGRQPPPVLDSVQETSRTSFPSDRCVNCPEMVSVAVISPIVPSLTFEFGSGLFYIACLCS